MKELMTYPLTPIPYKREKSKGLHFLTEDVEHESRTSDASTLIVNDGNAAFY